MSLKQLKWVFLIVLTLIWGSSFILIRKGLDGLNAFQLGSMRIIFTAIFLFIIGFKSLKKISKKQWKYIFITSFFGTFIPVYLFSIAETQISTSITSILNSLTPLFTLVFGVLLFKIGYERKQFLGVLVGLIGSALLIFSGAVSNPSQNYWYAVFVIIASIGYAINVNLIKRYLSDLNTLSITTGNFAVLFLPALLILCFTDFFDKFQHQETQYALGFVLILGVFGTGIANIIFFRLIQIATPVFASSVTFLIPIVACIWGLLFKEILTPLQLVGAFIVLIGVYLSSKK